MHLHSVNVGLPRVAAWRGEDVQTGIFKTPVAGPVMVRALNLDGDRQADPTVHGGVEKAVYGYPAEHYAFWREQLGEEFPWGAFGENLTTSGLDEKSLHIGDRLRFAPGSSCASTRCEAPSSPRLSTARVVESQQQESEKPRGERRRYEAEVGHDGDN